MTGEDTKIIEKCFRDARITGDLSMSSIKKYQSSLRKFFEIVDKKLSDLELEDFNEFIIKMQDNGAGNSRIANVISAVKWLIAQARQQGMVMDFDVESIKKPRIRKKPVVYLNEDEIDNLLKVIREDEKNWKSTSNLRMMALVMLLLQTGARIGEALSIKIDDIDRGNMEIEVIGKGSKQRTLYLRDDTLVEIDAYLDTRDDNCPYIFNALNKESQWQQTDVGRCFRRYRKLLGIKKHLTAHMLRHTYASQLTLNSVPINTVQYLLGHANLETTTRYYIGVVEKQKAKEYIKDKYFDFMPTHDT